jgi:large subunit ribosomal protein L40e
MHIGIATLTGKVNMLVVESSDTIENVKSNYRDQEDVLAGLQRFIFAGRELDDSRTISIIVTFQTEVDSWLYLDNEVMMIKTPRSLHLIDY